MRWQIGFLCVSGFLASLFPLSANAAGVGIGSGLYRSRAIQGEAAWVGSFHIATSSGSADEEDFRESLPPGASLSNWRYGARLEYGAEKIGAWSLGEASAPEISAQTLRFGASLGWHSRDRWDFALGFDGQDSGDTDTHGIGGEIWICYALEGSFAPIERHRGAKIPMRYKGSRTTEADPESEDRPERPPLRHLPVDSKVAFAFATTEAEWLPLNWESPVSALRYGLNSASWRTEMLRDPVKAALYPVGELDARIQQAAHRIEYVDSIPRKRTFFAGATLYLYNRDLALADTQLSHRGIFDTGLRNFHDLIGIMPFWSVDAGGAFVLDGTSAILGSARVFQTRLDKQTGLDARLEYRWALQPRLWLGAVGSGTFGRADLSSVGAGFTVSWLR